MKEQDEAYLWQRIKKEVGVNGKGGKKPRQIINEPSFPINHKRAWHLLYKWSGLGWYDYETTVDLGWVTPKGDGIQFQQIFYKSIQNECLQRPRRESFDQAAERRISLFRKETSTHFVLFP